MTWTKNIDNRDGFTLIELIVVMAVFITVLVISASAFNTILLNSGRLFKSEESNIQGMVGLEMLRHDLQRAGYGLYSESSTSTYSEAVDALPALNNDAPTNVPRPLVAGNNLDGTLAVDTLTPLPGTDYLSIKGTTVSRSSTAQKWNFMNITSSHTALPVVNNWGSHSDDLTPASDKVVILQKLFGNPAKTQLVSNPTGGFSYNFATSFSNLTTAANGMYTIYGIDTVSPRFPFNRTDYFVATDTATALPSSCAVGTGVLYKTAMSQQSGKLSYIPVLDCVLDMQVVYGWDFDGDGIIDTWTAADGIGYTSSLAPPPSLQQRQDALVANNNSLTTTPNIRSNLKMIKVYILAQDGRKDTSFTSTSPLTPYVGEESLTRSGITLTPAQRNYRWKLYRIVVRPKNLLANQ